MRFLRVLFHRAAGLFGKDRSDREFAEEIESNLQFHMADYVARGLTPAEAHRQAVMELGGVEQTKELYRDQTRLPFVETLLNDVRYSVRSLRKTPAFTVAAILTLALGIGANTAIFSAAEGIWLRPLVTSNLQRIAVLGQQTTRSQWYSVAPATYREWRARGTSFSQVTAYRNRVATLTGGSTPQRVQAAEVDSGLFEMMGRAPLLGRTFSTDEYEPGHRVAVLSYSLWQSQFGGSQDVIGRTLLLDGAATTIAGVMGQADIYPAATDLWLPLALAPQELADTRHNNLHVLGLVRKGVSREQAAAELDLLMRSVAQRSPADYEDLRPDVRWLRDVINGSMTPGFVRVLLGASGFVLLIGCINLGNLQLARAMSRRKEFSLRAALGCGRGRLARQVLTESMVLAISGAAVGVVLAYWAVRLMVTSMPPDTARQMAGWSTMSIDARVLLFTAAAAVVSGILAGLVPVARGFRFAPADALKSGTTSKQSAPQRLRGLLVGGEAAVALMLLVATMLVIAGFRHMLSSVASFEPQTLLTFEVELNSVKYASPAAKANFYAQAAGALRALPGVSSAATFTSYPMSNNGVTWAIFRTSDMNDARHLPSGIVQSVSPEFLQLLRIPLIAGRNLSDSDGPDTLRVALISEVMAKKYWPSASPLGRSVLLREGDREVPLTIVGVTGNVEYDWTDNAPEAAIYVPFRQRPERTALLAVRSDTPAAALAPEVRAALGRIDTDLPLSNVKTLDRLMVESLAGLLQIEGLMSSFGLIALLLAAAGIYGLVSYTVTQRTQEVGIRMAVGARAGDVLWLVLGQTLRLALLGAAVGLVGAVAMGRIVAGFFFGTAADNPLPFAAAFAVLVLTALLAGIGPALRAMKVDPMVALRHE